jgi:hypothetical protein
MPSAAFRRVLLDRSCIRRRVIDPLQKPGLLSPSRDLLICRYIDALHDAYLHMCNRIKGRLAEAQSRFSYEFILRIASKHHPEVCSDWEMPGLRSLRPITGGLPRLHVLNPSTASTQPL